MTVLDDGLRIADANFAIRVKAGEQLRRRVLDLFSPCAVYKIHLYAHIVWVELAARLGA